MGKPEDNKEKNPLINAEDLTDLQQIMSLAIIGAETDRATLRQILSYEPALKIRMQNTLAYIEKKQKDDTKE